jgi:SHS2 domain-containing protein
MGFRILEDITLADTAVECDGRDLPELFMAGANALIAVMVDDPGTVMPHERRTFSLEDGEIDLLLYAFLGELLYYKDAESLILVPEEVIIEKHDAQYRLWCSAAGETADSEKHSFNVDVKAVTFHKFNVKYKNNIWYATIVFDV